LSPHRTPDAPTIPEWSGVFNGKNSFSYYPSEPNAGFFTLTGGADAVNIFVPKGHRLVRLDLEQTDGSNTRNSSDLRVDLLKFLDRAEAILHDLVKYNSAHKADSGINILFGEGWERRQTKYQMQLTGTVDLRVWVELIIQYLDPVEPGFGGGD